MSFYNNGGQADLGNHANDAAARTACLALQWDTNDDGTGDPQDGMFYYNSTDGTQRVYLDGAWESYFIVGDGDLDYNGDDNGQLASLDSLTELTTIAAAASTDTVILIPQFALVYSVSVRVTAQIPTAVNFTVGTAADATLFSGEGRTVDVTLNTTDPCTAGGMNYFNAATAVRIIPSATPANNTGRVRTTIHYILVTPPTS